MGINSTDCTGPLLLILFLTSNFHDLGKPVLGRAKGSMIFAMLFIGFHPGYNEDSENN